jgi:hypothetical protein
MITTRRVGNNSRAFRKGVKEWKGVIGVKTLASFVREMAVN